ncbi:MAG: HAD-IC family P-type ATPase, partial [Arenibacterium sp.]
VVFDKTGTLTEGHPALSDMALVNGMDRKTLLGRVAAVEAASEHPVARALCEAAKAEGAPEYNATDFEAHPGLGVSANIDGARLLIGSERFLRAERVDTGTLSDHASAYAHAGKTVLFVAMDGKPAGVLAVSDPIREGMKDVIATLQQSGLKVAMLTGDTRLTADTVAAELEIDHVVADVLPDGKRDALRDLQASGHKIAFAGDGINDAPALAEADIGIAIGSGTDVAIEAGDVVLMSGDAKGLLRAITLSRATMRNIRQNLFWAFAYNTALIPVAAGVFFPLFGVMLSPVFAAGAMALSSVFVVSNALRLRHAGPPSAA